MYIYIACYELIIPPIYKTSYAIIPTILEGNTICFALWYLTAYLECLLVIYLCVRLKRTAVLPYLALAGYLVGLLCGGYVWLWANSIPKITYCNWEFNISRNFFTVCLPCVVFGILLRQFEYKLHALVSRLWILVISLILLLTLEYNILDEPYRDKDLLIFTVPLALIIFITALLFPCRFPKMSKMGKKYSTGIYLYHMLFLQIGYVFINTCNIDAYLCNLPRKYWLYPFVVLFSILSCWIYDKIKCLNLRNIVYCLQK